MWLNITSQFTMCFVHAGCVFVRRYSHFILLTTPILIIYYWFTWLVIPLPFFSSFSLHLHIIIQNKHNSSCLPNLFWSLMICWSIIILCFFLLFSFTQFNAKSNPFHHILIYTYSFGFYFIWFYTYNSSRLNIFSRLLTYVLRWEWDRD